MSKNINVKYIPNTYSITLTSKYLFDTIIGMRYTFKQFKEEYPDDKACLKAVLENRFGSTCPKCGVIDTTRLQVVRLLLVYIVANIYTL